MAHFTINHDIIDNNLLPSFSVTIEDSYATSIYSDTDMQTELTKVIQSGDKLPIFDLQEGLYNRLTVEENIVFYHKWFGCKTSIPEILVLFELQTCAKTPLYKCSESEVRRVYFAKYFVTGTSPAVFQEPIHGVDITTINIHKHAAKVKRRPYPSPCSGIQYGTRTAARGCFLQAAG